MSIVIRKGTKEDLDAYVALLQRVRQGMERKEWFYIDSREEIFSYLDRGIMHLWVAMDAEIMAGAFSLLIPGTAPMNYGHLLGFSEEELMQAVNMDSVAVHPDYRGLGLQNKLGKAAEDWLGENQNRILLCTVHPANRFSLRNVLSQGYVIQKEVSIYGSVRYVLQKNILKKQK